MARASGDYYPLDDPRFQPGLGFLPDREEPTSFRSAPRAPRSGAGHHISMEPHLPAESSGRIHAGDEEDGMEELPF